MVEIGGRPILWHIMRGYAARGFAEFVLALGYRQEAIKRYFLDYYHLSGHLTVALGTGAVGAHEGAREDWTVHLVDTGRGTQTGGRVKRLAHWLRDGTFMLTYGDGVSDVNVADVLAFHRRHGQLVAFRHGGFWQCMDTLRDLKLLESLWEGGRAPWQVWRE